MHDLFEGVVSEDLLAGIRILIKKGYFSVESYNKCIRNLRHSSMSSDIPQPIPISLKVKKLSGKAVSIWVHIRIFPLLIRHFDVERNETALQLCLKLHELVEENMVEFISYF